MALWMPFPATDANGRALARSSEVVRAARLSGGNSSFEDNEDVEIVLASVPTRTYCFKNVMLLYADLGGRPYRVEDFVTLPVASLRLPPEMVALRTCRMNHVCAVTFKNMSVVKKMLAHGGITVKNHRHLVIDPCNEDVIMKVNRLLSKVKCNVCSSPAIK